MAKKIKKNSKKASAQPRAKNPAAARSDLLNVPKNTTQNAPKNSVKNTPKSAVKNAPENSVKNTPKSAVKNAPKNSVKNAPKNSVKNAPKNSVKNTPQNAPKNPPQKPPQAPVNKKTKAAVKDAMNTRRTSVKRQRYRGGNYILYYLMFGLIIAVIFAVLANTVLFKCKEISVLGNVRYSYEDIVAMSGLNTGDNLLHVDSERAAEKIVSSLAYIDEAAVKKSYPTKLMISVVEAEKWYCVYQDGVYSAISRGGKIIEHCVPDKLTVVRGYEAQTTDVGARLSSQTEGKNEIPSEILEAAEKAGLKNIDEIDLTDRFSIKMTVDGRIFMELGPVTGVESKLIVAKDIIENHIGSSESVTMLLTNPEKVAVEPILPDQPDDELPSEPEEPESENPENPSE